MESLKCDFFEVPSEEVMCEMLRSISVSSVTQVEYQAAAQLFESYAHLHSSF